MAALVSAEKCIGCGRCKNVCPVGAIKLENGKAVIDENCIECGACVAECPHNAISLWKGELDMPGKDGTGPLGKGAGICRRAGHGSKRGKIGAVRTGQRGAAGFCICPKCGEKTIHTAGIPCTSLKCPKCGASMLRGF